MTKPRNSVSLSILSQGSLVNISEVIQLDNMSTVGELICTANYSPIIFNKMYRHGDNFKEVSLMVIDIDDTITLKEGAALFGKYRHVIATTRNHQKNKLDDKGRIKAGPCDRFRVIIPLSRTITDPDEYSALYQAMIQAYPGVDKSTCDLARFFYRSQEVVQVNEIGLHFDVDELINFLPPKKDITQDKNNYSKGAAVTLRAGGVRGELSRKTKDWLQNGSAEGDHYYRLVSAVADMRAQGYEYEEALDAAEQVFNKILGRDLERKFLINIQGIYNYSEGAMKVQYRAPRKLDVPGYDYTKSQKLLVELENYVGAKRGTKT